MPDYGMGKTNIDLESGIRYGVIPANDLGESWYESSESYYGEPSCPKCGNDAVDIDHESVPDLNEEDDWDQDGSDYACVDCKYTFDSDQAYGDEAISHNLDDGEYLASQGGDDCDIFIMKSPYYTYGPFCSPCAPGAVYLRDGDTEGEKAYCFAPDWFPCYGEDNDTGKYEDRHTSCPYPVYRVSDNVCIFTPNKAED